MSPIDSQPSQQNVSVLDPLNDVLHNRLIDRTLLGVAGMTHVENSPTVVRVGLFFFTTTIAVAVSIAARPAVALFDQYTVS